MDRTEWYADIDVLFQIIASTMHRETCFIPYVDRVPKVPIRWLNASAIKFLLMHFKKYGFLRRDMNLYYSLARYDFLPSFSYNWTKKSVEQKSWMRLFHQHIIGYDLFTETDSDDLAIAHEHTWMVRDIYDKFRLPYRTSFSGSKGWHVVVPYAVFSHLGVPIYVEERESDFLGTVRECPMTIKDIAKKHDLVWLFKVINLRLKTLYSIDTIDDTINDIKRVCKVPYSWDVKSGNICLPLTDEQFTGFDISMVKPEQANKNVKRRGMLWHEHDKPDVEGLLQDLGILI